MTIFKYLTMTMVLLGSFMPMMQGQGEVRADRINRIDELAKEAKKMFKDNNFSGVKVFRKKGDSYLFSFGSVPARGTMTVSTLDRAASAQARKEVMKYNDGITITEDLVLTFDESTKGDVTESNFSSYEILKESGTAIVSEMQTLCTFQEDEMFVHVLYLDLNGIDTKREKRRDRKDD